MYVKLLPMIMFILSLFLFVLQYNTGGVKIGREPNKAFKTACSAVLECSITGNYCNEDLFRYFIPIYDIDY